MRRLLYFYNKRKASFVALSFRMIFPALVFDRIDKCFDIFNGYIREYAVSQVENMPPVMAVFFKNSDDFLPDTFGIGV